MILSDWWRRMAGIAAITALLGTSSCLKDDFSKLRDPSWEPSFAFPIINSSMTVKDMINKFDSGGLVSEDPNKFLTLIYKGFVESDPAESLFTVPGKSFSQAFGLNGAEIGQLQLSGTHNVKQSEDISFTPPDTAQHIHVVVLKSGNLHLQITNTFMHNGSLKVTFPYLKINNIALTKTYAIAAYSGTPPPAQVIDDIDLTGYEMDLSKGGTTYNTLPVDYDLTLTYSGASTTTSDQITADLSISSLKFSYIDGYFGQLPYNVNSDTMEAQFFRNSLGGNIIFENPKLTVDILNSFGMPIQATFNQLRALAPSGTYRDMTASFIPGPVNFTAPSSPGQYGITTLVIDKPTSNIDSVLAIKPDRFIYNVDVTSNPGGNTGLNFMLDSSKYKMNFELNLPLHGRVQNLIIQDTLKLALPTMEGMESMFMKIITNNGFPLDADIQIFFADSAYAITDSLIDVGQYVVNSASIDGNGVVTSPRYTLSTVTLSPAKIERLRKAHYFIIQGRLETINNGGTPVKIYSDYRLDIKLSAKVSLKFD